MHSDALGLVDHMSEGPIQDTTYLPTYLEPDGSNALGLVGHMSEGPIQDTSQPSPKGQRDEEPVGR